MSLHEHIPPPPPCPRPSPPLSSSFPPTVLRFFDEKLNPNLPLIDLGLQPPPPLLYSSLSSPLPVSSRPSIRSPGILHLHFELTYCASCCAVVEERAQRGRGGGGGPHIKPGSAALSRGMSQLLWRLLSLCFGQHHYVVRAG